MLDVPVLDVDVRYLEPKYNLCKGISLFTVKQVLDVPVLDVDVRYLEPKYNLCKGISLFTVKQVLDVPVLDGRRTVFRTNACTSFFCFIRKNKDW